MTNAQIAKLLRHVAASYTIKNEAKFRFQIIAYQKAAEAIESSSTEIKDLAAEERLQTIPGVGPSMQQHLKDLFSKGSVPHFDKVMEDIPQAVFPLLDIPSFGPKKAYKLVTHFKLKDQSSVIADIKNLAEEGEIAKLEGFGEKSQADILQAINEYGLGVNKTSRMVLPFASEIAGKLIEYLKKSPSVLQVYPLGSLRRKKETIGDVDIAVATKKPQEVLDYFVAYPYKERIIEKGNASASLLISGGKHIDLMVQPPEAFGSLLQHFTGSKDHNIHLREYALKKGFSLSEYGIHKKSNPHKLEQYETEEKFYKALGLDWIPPEIRENAGEIELAEKHNLPQLIALSDMRGDFHLHSNFPIEPSHDAGADTMETMLKKAEELNYNYLGFSEHNPSRSNHTPKQVYELLTKRSKKIDQLRKSTNSVHIFSLLETDILPNGNLAIDDESLSLLDGTLISIHSVFGMSKLEMTKRVLKGLRHPKAKILTHPTGRLINQRPGYELEWEEIFAFCKTENKAIEVNSWPVRLDLPDSLVRRAVESGVKLFINTDSHAVSHMDLMRYGVWVARRGFATKDDILNALEYNKLAAWFKK